MAGAIQEFSLEVDGLNVGCRLVLTETECEFVRFKDGLSGKPVFNQLFASFVRTMDYTGIWTENRSFVRSSDEGFGKAFYERLFPKLAALNPGGYRWEKLG